MKFFCEYCGNRIDAEIDRKCPNCGASYKKNKNFIKIQEEKNKQHEINTEFKNNIMNHAVGIMKISKIMSIMPIIIFLVVISIIVFGFINTHKSMNDDSNKIENDIENIFESVNEELNDNSEKNEEKITVKFNEYGETKKYKFKVINYETVEDKFRKAGEGYELIKFYFMLSNLSGKKLTKEDVYCIVDGVSQTNDITSGYSDLPMFIAKDLTVTGTATFVVPKNAVNYDIRYGDYITVHIEK